MYFKARLWQWRSQGHCFGGGEQVARGEGILGFLPPNFYTDLVDFSNDLEHIWGGRPPLTTPLVFGFVQVLQ